MLKELSIMLIMNTMKPLPVSSLPRASLPAVTARELMTLM